jgi:hypothetical protein
LPGGNSPGNLKSKLPKNMNHSEVAHRWSNDSYTRKGTLTGPRMFAEQSDRTIYSHGHHFCIARKTDLPGFRYLVTNRSYSPSTSKHQTEVARAIGYKTPRFYCHNPADSFTTILHDEWTALEMDTLRALNELRAKVATMESRIAARAEKRQPVSDTLASRLTDLQGREASKAAEIAARIADLEALRIAAGIKPGGLGKSTQQTRRTFISSDLSKVSATFAKRSADYAKKKAKADAAYIKEAIARKAENRAKWLAGEPGARYATYEHSGEQTLLRVIGDEVQTSAGASVPVRHALRLFKLASEVKARGELWMSPSEKTFHVGHYTLTAIDQFGNVTIGCHHLAFDEMARIEIAVRVAIHATAEAGVSID